MLEDHGTGKTTFALDIATNISKKNKKVYYICLEMSDTQIMSKVLSYEANISSQIIFNGIWNNNEMEKINNAINTLCSNDNLVINTKLRYLEDIISKIKRLKAKGELDVVIIDYMSLICTRQKNQTVRDKVSQISRELKLLSLELDIPIIVLSQLNREAENREPSIADLRESGSVEQDADNIILLHCEEEEKNKATSKILCKLAKHRAGMTMNFNMLFVKSVNRYSCIEE